jgi:hypothetical protein
VISPISPPGRESVPQWPEPEFEVLGVRDIGGTAAPVLAFELRVNDASARAVQVIALHCDIRIEPARRNLTSAERSRLGDLVRAAGAVGTANDLAWSRSDVHVPAFTGSVRFLLQIPCTFDLGKATVRYLHALDGGSASLLFRFTGSIFYVDERERLQVVSVARDRQASFEMPTEAWKRMMARHHPEGTWLHLRPETLDRLRAVRAARGLWSDDAALLELIEAAECAPGVIGVPREPREPREIGPARPARHGDHT